MNITEMKEMIKYFKTMKNFWAARNNSERKAEYAEKEYALRYKIMDIRNGKND